MLQNETQEIKVGSKYVIGFEKMICIFRFVFTNNSIMSTHGIPWIVLGILHCWFSSQYLQFAAATKCDAHKFEKQVMQWTSYGSTDQADPSCFYFRIS